MAVLIQMTVIRTRQPQRAMAKDAANQLERRHTPPRASRHWFGVLICCSAVATAPACKPAATVKGPTISEVCITALNATDEALAVAVALAPDADLPVLEEYTRQWEQAASVAKAGGDLCPIWPSIDAIAKALDCGRCRALIATAEEELQCSY